MVHIVCSFIQNNADPLNLRNVDDWWVNPSCNKRYHSSECSYDIDSWGASDSFSTYYFSDNRSAIGCKPAERVYGHS